MKSFYAIASLLAGGGIGNTAYHAVAGLERAGRLQRLVALGHRPCDIPEERITDVRFLPRRALFPLGDKAFYWLKNRRFDLACRRALRGDSSVVHLWNSQATGTARQAKAAGQKLVIDRASTHILTQTDILVDAYARFGIHYSPTYRETIERCREEYELADVVLTPSPNSYESFAAHGFELRKVVRCPFGVDFTKITPRREPPERFVALFVGQIGVRKGVPTLLDAWDRAGLDGELWLAGGEEEAIRPHLVPWRDRPDIRWLGFRRDVPELMRRASVFVFPSLEEGSALVTYEAMAAGLPLIVTPAAGSVARPGEEALFVDAYDADGLAAALTELQANPDRAATMGHRARGRVEQFPWQAYGDRVAAVHAALESGESLPVFE
ncbi:MAG: glycosyltransferase family 4 protein [Candidatus Lernaella stagnicola]|nr:glycosyltransferase family 4 protein [Candidatus Lernaella stagnicola]